MATLVSVGGDFWHLRAALWALRVTLVLLWEHLRHMGVPLGSLRSDFGVSLGSVWVSVGKFGSLDGHFGMIVKLLWVCLSAFSKNTHFLNRFK